MSHSTSFLRSLKWAFVMNWGQRAISMGFTFVLASLLGPHDFGLVAMALVYIAFVQLFLEQGIMTAIIQRERLEPGYLDSAFWMNLAWCVVLACGSVGLAGWWATANETPELAGVIKVLSLLLLIEGLNIVQQAYLQREMKFKALAVRANVAVLLGGSCGLVLALLGAGVWALVAQQLVTDGVALLLIWVLSPWKPGFAFSRAHSRQILRFSFEVFFANLGGFVNRRADSLLMGIFFGPVAVGLYRFADRVVDTLLEVTMRPVGLVSLPLFSRLRSDREGLRNAVGSCIRTTLLVTVPVLLVLAAISEELLAVVGQEWKPAANALKLLALVGIAKGVVFFTGPLLFAVAKPRFRAIMLWSLAAMSTVAVAVVGKALQSDPQELQVLGMAASRAALFVLVFIPVQMAVVVHISGLRARSLMPWLPGPMLSGCAAIAAVTGVRWTGGLESLSPFVALLISTALGVTVAGCVLLALEPRARAELNLLRRRMAGHSPDVPGGVQEIGSLANPSDDLSLGGPHG